MIKQIKLDAAEILWNKGWTVEEIKEVTGLPHYRIKEVINLVMQQKGDSDANEEE